MKSPEDGCGMVVFFGDEEVCSPVSTRSIPLFFWVASSSANLIQFAIERSTFDAAVCIKSLCSGVRLTTIRGMFGMSLFHVGSRAEWHHNRG